MKSTITYQLTLLVFIGLFFTSCNDFPIGPVFNFDSWTTPHVNPTPLTPQTTILAIEIEPNPVVAGNDITFTCIISDSLDTTFNYQWSLYLGNDGYLDSLSTENSITITSPEVVGSYEGYISVYNDLNDPKTKPAHRDFEYRVIE